MPLLADVAVLSEPGSHAIFCSGFPSNLDLGPYVQKIHILPNQAGVERR